MVAQETKEGPLELALVSCQTCDTAFIGSERRTTCPACGGEAAGPYFQWTLEADGLRLKNGAAPETLEETPAAAGVEPPAVEAEAPPPAEEPAGAVAEVPVSAIVFGAAAGAFVYGEGRTEDDLRGMLADLGAEPEAAAIAVGRLAAVRGLIVELAESGREATLYVTDELIPEDGPDGRASEEAPAEEEAAPAPAEAPEGPSEPETTPEPA